jgi:hypothetical protein
MTHDNAQCLPPRSYPIYEPRYLALRQILQLRSWNEYGSPYQEWIPRLTTEFLSEWLANRKE